MAPNTKDFVTENVFEKLNEPQTKPRKFEIVYKNIVIFGYWHVAGLYGLYLCFTSARAATVLFGFILYTLAEIGITAGAHRLWSHKSYKAKLPLQILLMVMNSIAFQNSIIEWVRDHRLHHKYSDTDADPHNATRGFFYSHVGWLLVKKHEEVKTRGKKLDISDLHANPVLRFQKKYAVPFIGVVCFILPTYIPMYFWSETLNNAWHITMLRYVLNLNVTFLVNSAAHIWGYKPYDSKILPAQNLFASVATFGEGFHNYHHVFPWDYRTSELGNKYLNLTAAFIDFFAMIGWAYDLKTVPENIIKMRKKRSGDGTNLWGWDDKDLSEEDKKNAVIFYAEDAKIEDHPHLIFLKTRRYIRSREVKLGELPHHVLIFRLYNKWTLTYRAFCAGSIITQDRVLTSSSCFLTNRKRYKKNLATMKVVSGILTTVVKEPVSDDSETQQWRSVKKIYSQKFYRFPAYDLCILELKKPWNFNGFVNKIPYASKNLNFDGVCESTSVKATKSWSFGKSIFTEQLQLIKRKKCERLLLRSCRLYYCTVSITKELDTFFETEGGGLICHGTGDPEEVDESQGILVGVTTVINIGLPSVHTRVALFNKWITDGSCLWKCNGLFVITTFLLNFLYMF